MSLIRVRVSLGNGPVPPSWLVWTLTTDSFAGGLRPDRSCESKREPSIRLGAHPSGGTTEQSGEPALPSPGVPTTAPGRGIRAVAIATNFAVSCR